MLVPCQVRKDLELDIRYCLLQLPSLADLESGYST